MRPIFASWPTSQSSVMMFMAGTVSERLSLSSMRLWQLTLSFACFASLFTTTALRYVLMPPYLLIDFVLMTLDVYGPRWIIFAPVSRFCPLPAKVMPVNSQRECAPFKMVIGYKYEMWLPNEPLTHSMVPPSSTIARFVLRLYMFL